MSENELTNTNMLLVRPNQKPKEIEANSQEINNPVVFQNYRELESASVYQDMFPDVLVLMQTNQNDKTLVWNRTIKDPDGVIVDAIRGDMLICRMEKNGDLKGLSKEEMTFFKETFKHPELIMEIDSAILSIAVPALKNEKNQLE